MAAAEQISEVQLDCVIADARASAAKDPRILAPTDPAALFNPQKVPEHALRLNLVSKVLSLSDSQYRAVIILSCFYLIP